jgi:hypothetical protein
MPKNTAVANAVELWLRQSRISAELSLVRPGTGFLDAETGPSKSAPETTDVPQRPKGAGTDSGNPGTNAYLSLMGKYAVRQDWVVGTTGEPLLNYIKYLQEGAG